MEEYNIIREELEDKLKTQERLTQLCYTIVLAIWTAAFTINSEWVLLFALLIVVPISVRILKSRMDSAFLAAYMIVCLEPKLDIQWESNNAKYCNKHFRDKELTSFHIFMQLDFIFLSLITSLLFWIMRGGAWLVCDSCLIAVAIALAQSAVIVFEGFVVKQFYKYNAHRTTYINRWKEVLAQEENGNEKVSIL